MKQRLTIVAAIFLFQCAACDPAVLFNAPPELDGARVYVDDQAVGYLKASHSYRWGRYAAPKEMSAPPRFEANLALDHLPIGTHRLRIVKSGYIEYRGTFRNMSAHVEVFVPNDAAQKVNGREHR